MICKKNAIVLLAGAVALPAAGQERPNFVWFMTEDVSDCYLSIYNEGRFGAETPNVERLAEGGVIFSNAYSNAPVSSAARSTLITGCYAPRLGVSFHRKLQLLGMAEGTHMFPAYLRQAGYHTSNAAKQDYNCKLDKDAWDIPSGKMGDWRKRPDKDMPFFHVRTNAGTHESSLQFSRKTFENVPTQTDPEKVFIHPNHPDTKLFRYTYATFYDRITKVDKEVGKMIDMLEEDGLMDNTFIFYFGDNGGSLPGSKGYTTETGLTVPLVVYVPEKWRDRLSVKAGTFNDGLVSFMDFGPTLLHLAGIEVPEYMDGQPFFGDDIDEDDLKDRTVYGYGDRYDEFYAFNRTVSRGEWFYARNFQPYHPKGMYAKYRYNQLAFQDWREMYEEGWLNKLQCRFFDPQGAEELYNLKDDPYQTRNLVDDPACKAVLKELREDLQAHMTEMNDLGFYPECEWLKGASDPVSFGNEHAAQIRLYSEIADYQLLPYAKAEKKLKKALQSADPVARYWAATSCASFGKLAKSLEPELQALSKDPVGYVRSRAAVAMAHFGVNPIFTIREALQIAGSGAESLLILNDAVYIQDHVLSKFNFQLSMDDVPMQCDRVDWRIQHLSK